METNEPNVYPTILGGVSRGFRSPFKDLGARSAIFWHLKTGTFAKNWRQSIVYALMKHLLIKQYTIFSVSVNQAAIDVN